MYNKKLLYKKKGLRSSSLIKVERSIQKMDIYTKRKLRSQ